MTPKAQLVRLAQAYNVSTEQHTAGGTGASVASLQGLLVATLAKIVSAGMHNNGAL
jgi:hypothetical protein